MRPRCFIIIAIIIIVVAAALYFVLRQSAIAPTSPAENNSTMSTLTVSEALAIAKASACVNDGLVQEESFYNPNSKTWWFILKADKAGCNPACVVSEETKTAETNWRCTGLIVPDDSANEAIRQLFVAKYPKYAQTISVRIIQGAADFARGSVGFAPGAPGGIFLAAKVNGQWKLVHDGNGQIPCSLSSYGFPSEMLSDCAE